MKKEFIESIGKGPVVGIFGDTVFPNKATGEGFREKTTVISELKKLLLEINPKKVYVIPHRGVSLTSLLILQYLNIPYTLVNPYKGYFNNIVPKDKIKVLLGMENSSAIVTMGKPPKNVEDSVKAFNASEDFIIERSDLIISISGDNPGAQIKNLEKKLPESKTNVIFFKY